MKNIWVIKAGGELLANPSVQARLISDLIELGRTKPVIFIHGGGPQIQTELSKEGIPAIFKNGRRVTSTKAMSVVEKTLSGPINKSLAAALSRRGCRALGLSGRDAQILTGKLLPGLGRAATPARVNTQALVDLLKAGYLPILSSVASDAQGKSVNINADDFASAIATAVECQHLVFLTNTDGVLDHQGRRISSLKIGHTPKLIQDGVITGGMIPKVQSAVRALHKGVGEVDILNGRKGLHLKFGTRIVKS